MTTETRFDHKYTFIITFIHIVQHSLFYSIVCSVAHAISLPLFSLSFSFSVRRESKKKNTRNSQQQENRWHDEKFIAIVLFCYWLLIWHGNCMIGRESACVFISASVLRVLRVCAFWNLDRTQIADDNFRKTVSIAKPKSQFYSRTELLPLDTFCCYRLVCLFSSCFLTFKQICILLNWSLFTHVPISNFAHIFLYVHKKKIGERYSFLWTL